VSNELRIHSTIDLIFELNKREDFYGLILYVKNPPSDILVCQIPEHVDDSDANKMLKIAVANAEGQ
jgi:hypothetical protein